MGLEENKAVVQRLFDEINSRNLDELPQVVAPDVVDHNAVIFMQPEGPGGCAGGHPHAAGRVPGSAPVDRGADRRRRPGGGQIHPVGHQHRDYRGLPAPTQQHFESEAIAILRVAAGRVVEIRGTADRLGMLTQLGILPDIG
jgi:ketosteroid isomerase-like protein